MTLCTHKPVKRIGLAKHFKWMLQCLGSPLLEECIFSQQGYWNLRLLEYSLGNQDHHCKVWSLLVLIYFIGFLLDLELIKCGLVKSGSYLYTEDLLALDIHCSARATAISTQTSHLQDYSQLVWEKWVQWLKHHWNRRFAAYILIGIRQGFCIGFNRMQTLQNATRNLPNQVPSMISEYWAREISLTRKIKLSVGIWPSGSHSKEE